MVEEKIERLRAKGVVLTIQRLAVLECLQDESSHPTAEEIHRKVKEKYPTLSLATVYNTLEMFKQAEVVRELNIGKERRFEPFSKTHHHFHCRICNRIFDVKIQCPVAEKSRVDGHKVERTQAAFYGVCADCLKQGEYESDKNLEYRCGVCGWAYRPQDGHPDAGIKPGTPFEELPDDWTCQVCGAGKRDFFAKNAVPK